jgi:hypothetical protein
MGHDSGFMDDGDGTYTRVIVENGEVHFQRWQDCEPEMDYAKGMRADGEGARSPDLRHRARFPVALVEKYCNDAGITFADFMQDRTHIRRMLADPALAYFRINDGARPGVVAFRPPEASRAEIVAQAVEQLPPLRPVSAAVLCAIDAYALDEDAAIAGDIESTSIDGATLT